LGSNLEGEKVVDWQQEGEPVLGRPSGLWG